MSLDDDIICTSDDGIPNAIQITDVNGDYVVGREVFTEWLERQLCVMFGLPASYFDAENEGS